MTGALLQHLKVLVKDKRDFKIRLPRYDGGSQIFWPCYNGGLALLRLGTLIIGTWYGQLLVATVIDMLEPGKTLAVQTIPQEDSQVRALRIVMKVSDVAAVLMPQ